MRLIDADRAVAGIEIAIIGACLVHNIDRNTEAMSVAQAIKDFIQTAPTIDPESLRPKGEWEVDKFGIWRCPNCRHSIYDEEHLSSFCPNCGADMRKEATPNE